jgi:hypothetical protein
MPYAELVQIAKSNWEHDLIDEDGKNRNNNAETRSQFEKLKKGPKKKNVEALFIVRLT